MLKNNKIILILDNIRSVQNVASIFRTADGFGVSEIYLIGQSPEPIDRFKRPRSDFAKVSLGAEKSIPYSYFENIELILENLKKEDYQIIAIEQSTKAKDLKTINKIISDKVAIILGNEVQGVPIETLNKVDHIFEIKMLGKKESFNVSIVAGIVLYQIREFFD